MTIQLVETSDDDIYLAVAGHVAELLNEGANKTALAETPGSKFYGECEALLAESRHMDFVKRMIGQLDLVYKHASPQDAECIINAVVHAAAKVAPQEMDSAVQLFCSALSKGDDREQERLAALANLYGLCPSPSSQYTALTHWCRYAQRSRGLASSVAAALKGRADDVAYSLSLKPDKEVELYLLLAGVFKVKVCVVRPFSFRRRGGGGTRGRLNRPELCLNCSPCCCRCPVAGQ